MAIDTLLLTAGTIGAAGGVAVLRMSWGRETRSASMNALGWIVLGIGLAAWTAAGGAWGVAVGASIAMLTAGLFLGVEALTSRAGSARQPRTARQTVKLHTDSPLALGRRVGTFLTVVPGALAVSMLVALAGQTLARGAWAEADSTAFGLMLFPLAWTILALALMFRERLRSALIDLLAVAAVSGGIVLALS